MRGFFCYNTNTKNESILRSEQTMIAKTYMIPEENAENLEKKFNEAERQMTKREWKLAGKVTRNCFRRFGPKGKTSAA